MTDSVFSVGTMINHQVQKVRQKKVNCKEAIAISQTKYKARVLERKVEEVPSR